MKKRIFITVSFIFGLIVGGGFLYLFLYGHDKLPNDGYKTDFPTLLNFGVGILGIVATVITIYFTNKATHRDTLLSIKNQNIENNRPFVSVNEFNILSKTEKRADVELVLQNNGKGVCTNIKFIDLRTKQIQIGIPINRAYITDLSINNPQKCQIIINHESWRSDLLIIFMDISDRIYSTIIGYHIYENSDSYGIKVKLENTSEFNKVFNIYNTSYKEIKKIYLEDLNIK